MVRISSVDCLRYGNEVLLGLAETSPATTRELSHWPSTSASLTSPVSSHPISTGPKILRGTGLDVRDNRSNPIPLTTSTDGIELGLVGMGLVVLSILVFNYKRINAQREAIMTAAGESGGLQYTDEELRRMADKAPNFRYVI